MLYDPDDDVFPWVVWTGKKRHMHFDSRAEAVPYLMKKTRKYFRKKRKQK